MVMPKIDSFHVFLPRCCRSPSCNSSPTVHWSLEPVAYPRCLLEFDAHIARQAVDVHDLAAAIEGSLDLLIYWPQGDAIPTRDCCGCM